MGQGTTRVVEANGADGKVELDRRRHRLTKLPHQMRRHAGSIVGALVVVGLAIAVPVALARRRTRWTTLASRGRELRDKAQTLGQALGRIAHDPDRLAPPRPPVIGVSTIVAMALTATQILAKRLLAPPAGRR